MYRIPRCSLCTACGVLFLFLFQCLVALNVDGDHFKRIPKSKRCNYFKKYGMMAADCYYLDLYKVPTNLRADIEILDSSFNRIRELYKDTFTRYTSLRFLYLQDNMISFIEEGTFDPLQYVEVIDLSLNSLSAVPSGVLQLPVLRKLYINNNRLDSSISGGFIDAPLRETLEFLSLADCFLQELPSLHMYPNLHTLNVSGNELRTISLQQLAPMCSLQLLDLRRNPALFKLTSTADQCECQILSEWMNNKEISMADGPTLNCTSKGQEMKLEDLTHCGNVTESKEATEKYGECVAFVQAQEEAVQTRKTWITVSIAVAACIGTVLIVLFWLHRRNKRKRKKENKLSNNNNAKIPAIVEDETTTNQLLKDAES